MSSEGIVLSLEPGGAGLLAASGGSAMGDVLRNFANAEGSAYGDTISGSAAANSIDGRGGLDSISAGAGDDHVIYYAAGDTLDGGAQDSGGDTLILRAGSTAGLGDLTIDLSNALDQTSAVGETSIVRGFENVDASALSASIAVIGSDASNLVRGGGGNDTLGGGLGADTLVGNGGNDSLDGGVGADSMVGGAGDDTYVVDDVADVVVEAAAEGVDTVRTTLQTFSLALGGLEQIENLAFIDRQVGGTPVGYVGSGNALANVISGAEGADTLTAGSQDTLSGGGGNDRFIVNVADAAVFGGAGIDTVVTDRTSFTLTPPDLENLIYDNGAAADGDFTGVGNSGDNSIRGGDGADVLSGLEGNDTLAGGAGANTLDGGSGNDVYVIDNKTTVIADASGIDEIRTSGLSSLTLAGYSAVENLTHTGTSAFRGSGNVLDNVVTGGSGNDTLYGRDGNDTLVGGDGERPAQCAVWSVCRWQRERRPHRGGRRQRDRHGHRHQLRLRLYSILQASVGEREQLLLPGDGQ